MTHLRRDDLVLISEAARLANVQGPQIYKMAKSNQLFSSVVHRDGRVHVRRDELENYIRLRTIRESLGLNQRVPFEAVESRFQQLFQAGKVDPLGRPINKLSQLEPGMIVDESSTVRSNAPTQTDDDPVVEQPQLSPTPVPSPPVAASIGPVASPRAEPSRESTQLRGRINAQLGVIRQQAIGIDLKIRALRAQVAELEEEQLNFMTREEQLVNALTDLERIEQLAEGLG